jgi:hypothetical protein
MSSLMPNLMPSLMPSLRARGKSRLSRPNRGPARSSKLKYLLSLLWEADLLGVQVSKHVVIDPHTGQEQVMALDVLTDAILSIGAGRSHGAAVVLGLRLWLI